MKKRGILAVIALVLALTLTGCNAVGLREYTDRLSGILSGATAGRVKLVYTHPSLDPVERKLADACALAETETDVDRVLEAVWAYYDAYDEFYTQYDLANIQYCVDLTDEYWKGEYEYCSVCADTVSQGLDTLYESLAACPLRDALEEAYFGEGFFEAYDGESVWTEEFAALMARETELTNRYYELTGQATEEPDSQEFYDAWTQPLGQILVDLVQVRQQIAAQYGYENYVNLAYDLYYGRGFTPEEGAAYLEGIRETLVPLLDQAKGAWELESCTDKLALDYVSSAASAMGAPISDAARQLRRGRLYNIGSGENRFDGSFELYLSSYQVPFLFATTRGYSDDCLTLAHEFGHFAADCAVPGGSYAGTDIAEVHSQGMEYMTICYADISDTSRQRLLRGKLADALYDYLDQGMYACFEQRLYGMDPETLTVEKMLALYRQTLEDFGWEPGEYDERDLVTVHHFYTEPLYMISYVVSCDVALELYQLEAETPGAGLDLYCKGLVSDQSDILAFAEELGLESPLAPGRLEKAAKVLGSLAE